MSIRRSASIGLPVNRHKVHKPHQSTDGFAVQSMALVLKVPGHMLHVVIRCLKELFFVQYKKVEVHGRLARQFALKTTTARSSVCGIEPRPISLGGSYQSSRASPAEAALSVPDKKSFAIASSLSLVGREGTLLTPTTGAALLPRSKMSAAPSSVTKTSAVTRPLVVRHQVSCRADLHSRRQLTSRSERPEIPSCQHGLRPPFNYVSRRYQLAAVHVQTQLLCLAHKAQRPFHE